MGVFEGVVGVVPGGISQCAVCTHNIGIVSLAVYHWSLVPLPGPGTAPATLETLPVWPGG